MCKLQHTCSLSIQLLLPTQNLPMFEHELSSISQRLFSTLRDKQTEKNTFKKKLKAKKNGGQQTTLFKNQPLKIIPSFSIPRCSKRCICKANRLWNSSPSSPDRCAPTYRAVPLGRRGGSKVAYLQQAGSEKSSPLTVEKIDLCHSHFI